MTDLATITLAESHRQVLNQLKGRIGGAVLSCTLGPTTAYIISTMPNLNAPFRNLLAAEAVVCLTGLGVLSAVTAYTRISKYLANPAEYAKKYFHCELKA